MSGRQHLDSIADAVAAGEAVDWHDVERVGTKTRDADLIRQLKIVSAIGSTRRTQTPSGSSWWDRTVETGVAVVLAIAIAKLALAVLGAPTALSPAAWPYFVNVLIFGGGGVVLLAGGGRDGRLPLLGGLFLTIGSAFATSLMSIPGAGLGGTLAAVLRPLQPEAFSTLMLWRFVSAFPVDIQRPRAARFSSAFVNFSFVVGGVLFATNATS